MIRQICGIWVGTIPVCRESGIFQKELWKTGFTNVRLVGDGNVIYESETLNAQNQSVEFNVDVIGIRELQLEYNGSADLNGVMLGIADGRLIPVECRQMQNLQCGKSRYRQIAKYRIRIRRCSSQIRQLRRYSQHLSCCTIFTLTLGICTKWIL